MSKQYDEGPPTAAELRDRFWLRLQYGLLCATIVMAILLVLFVSAIMLS